MAKGKKKTGKGEAGSGTKKTAKKRTQAEAPEAAPAPQKSRPLSSEKQQTSKTQPPKPTPRKSRTLADILQDSATAEQARQLSQNLSAAVLESQALLSDMAKSSVSGGAITPKKNDPLGVMDAFTKLGKSLAAHPERLMAAQMQLAMGHMQAWQTAMTLKPAGEASPDKRFKDPDWEANPFFSYMKSAWKVNADWLTSLVNLADDLSDHDRKKALFYAQQASDAFSPSNFFVTNPEAIKAMIETGGESVLNGLRQARKDLERGHGKLKISQTDDTPFVVGENVATAPGEVVFRSDLFELLQYAPTTKTVHERPLLIFPPWINKFYILDLREENSMIRWLVDQGFTVFVVSWRSADEVTRHYSWDDYALKGALTALETVQDITNAEHVNTVGYCIGGTLLSGVLAYLAKSGADQISSATYFASQSDFSDAGDLLILADEASRATITDTIAANGGLMPGDIMAETFNYLRPVDLVWRYVVDNYLLGRKPRPFDLLFWNADQTNIPGPTHETYLNELYGDNALAKGDFQLMGEKVGLSDIKTPVYMQAARQDHISPYPSVYKGAMQFGGPVEFVLAGSGHIAGVINHPDAKKYQYWTNDDHPTDPETWLAGAKETPGSWWPHWLKWLKARSGARVPARIPIASELGPAPGSYVKVRLSDIEIGKPTER